MSLALKSQMYVDLVRVLDGVWSIDAEIKDGSQSTTLPRTGYVLVKIARTTLVAIEYTPDANNQGDLWSLSVQINGRMHHGMRLDYSLPREQATAVIAEYVSALYSVISKAKLES